MTLKFRRFLYTFFILLFLVLGPLLIIYARGYRFDLARQRVVKTGGLSIDSTPRNAQVYLNGTYTEPNWIERRFVIFKTLFGMRKMGGNTPAIFQNLIPDSYQIIVEKPDYHTWTKKIEIYPEQVAFLENIYLFLNQPTSSTIGTWNNIDSAWPSDDNRSLAFSYFQNNQWHIALGDLAREQVSVIYSSPFKPSDCLWNNGSSRLLLTFANRLPILLDLKNNSALTDFTLQNLKSLTWSVDNPDLLYAASNLSIDSFNAKTQTLEPSVDLSALNIKRIYSLAAHDNQLWLLTLSTDNRGQLISVKSNSQAPRVILTDLSEPQNYSFRGWHDDILLLYNNSKSGLLAVNTSPSVSESARLTEIFARGWSWQGDSPRLLYWDQFELGILTFDLKNEYQPAKQEILSRYSQPLTNAIWFGDYNYVIFNLNGSLRYLEIDNRNHRNTDTLLAFGVSDSLLTASDPGSIFVLSASTLYKIRLQ